MEVNGLESVNVMDVMGNIAGEVIGRTFYGFNHKTATINNRTLTNLAFELELRLAKLS
jgi:hypothetical protein